MSNEPYVILKGRKDGITIFVNEEADFEEIKRQLQKKVADAKQFFDGANTHVTFKGRELTDEDERALLAVIFAETSLDVSFIVDDDFIGKSPRMLPLASERLITSALGQYTEQTTMYHQGGLRSGQSIKYNGSVVIIGDVNPGSEVIAHGNVVVLGALKGMVHAGSTGNADCFVAALALAPTQLRIANIITYIPKEPGNPAARPGGSIKQTGRPSYAYVQNGQVYIAPLMD